MDDDDDMPGGGTLVIVPEAVGGAPAPRGPLPAGVAFPVHPAGNFQGFREESTTHIARHDAGPTPTQMLPLPTDWRVDAPASPTSSSSSLPMPVMPVGSGPMNRNMGTLPLPGSHADPYTDARSTGSQQRAVGLGAPSQEARPLIQEAQPLGYEPQPLLHEPRGMYPSLPDPLAPATGVRMAPAVPRFVEQATTVTRRKKSLLMPMLGSAAGAAVVMVGVVAFVVLRQPPADTPSDKTSTTSATPATSATTAAETPVPVSTSAPTSTALPPPQPEPTLTAPPITPPAPSDPDMSSPAGLVGADADAVAALEKLRSAIVECVNNSTHVLPGTSPPVPATLSLLRTGEYQPSVRDWGSPFFHCTKFRLEGPMRFRLQWLLEQPNWSGAGVAWIDDGGDGKVDRAYAFQMTLKQRDVVELGQIRAIEATRKLPVPR